MSNDSPDVFYYNLSVLNPQSNLAGGLGVLAQINANNNIPICKNPEDYYCSIIRFQIPGINIPLIKFLIQEPVTNINLGIYSFTIKDNTTQGNQTYVLYVPQIALPANQIPTVQTPPGDQQFGLYYFLYDYTLFITMLNTALASAVASYNTVSGNTATPPFFHYDAPTQLITLYADKAYYDQSLTNPVKIYFNNPLRNYFAGLAYNNTSLIQPTTIGGLDNYILVKDFYGINETHIPPTTTTGINYLTTQFQYNAYGYWSFLKSILITTNMNVVSETFYINNPTEFQNTQFVNVLTDYLPDLGIQNGAGISSQIYIYNASSLYRIFEFKQKTPLYNVSLNIGYTDTNGNYYPLFLDIGQESNFKLMFIKKSVYQSQNIRALKM